MMEKEWRKLETVEQRAKDCMRKKNYRAAYRELKKLEKSFLVSEATALRVELEGTMLFQQGKVAEACELVKANLGYLWGNGLTWCLTRQVNAPVTEASKQFTLKLTGSGIGLGVFTYFPPESISTFDVVAPSPERALEYVKLVVNFESPDKVRILSEERQSQVLAEIEHEGVLMAHPFTHPQRDGLQELAY
ncbi:MAG: hypothetical protein KDD70_08965 [Bdellovibrionales bacterium]|nr:hypothetical protein [Bdellovibrionales bacterium]